MDVKVLLLMNFALKVANCQSTISNRNDATSECQQFEDIMPEMRSIIRQLLANPQRASPNIGMPVIQEMKSEIEHIKSEMGSIRRLLTNQQQTAVRSETQMMQQLKSEIDEIRQLVIQHQNCSRNEQRKTGCPLGFDYLPEVGSCYKVISERMTWDNATERCRQLMSGAHLAAITSRKENDAIVGYLQMHSSIINNDCNSSRWSGAGNVIWIGGQTRNANRCGDPFVWKTQRGIEIPFNYTNWASGDPDCHQSKEHCAQIVTGRSYTWNDGDCDSFTCAICELCL